MSAGKVRAQVRADGVLLTLPQHGLQVLVTREQGRQLRDVLGAVLPLAPMGEPSKKHLLSIAGDVEPALSGPFADERDRVEAAQDYRRAHGDEDGLYRIDATGTVTVGTFSGAELELPAARLPVVVGDRVSDPHDGAWREIISIDASTAYMADSGCMSVAECAACEIRLPGEVLS